MSWPEAAEGDWPDDHTAAARAEYLRYVHEARRYSPPPVDPEWREQGPTAVVLRHAGLTCRYLTPPSDVADLGAA